MTIPASPPRRYTTSRQLIAGDDFNNLSDHNYSFQTLTATGATQAAAASVNAANVEIPAGNAAAGIKLPIAYPGQDVTVVNNSSNTITVYGAGTDVVQSGNAPITYAAAATGVTMATLTSYYFTCIKKGFWQRTVFGGV
jgi:hypothetical protein